MATDSLVGVSLTRILANAIDVFAQVISSVPFFGAIIARREVYKYHSLQAGNEFRILILLPASGEAPLSGTLLISRISEVIPYTALSYAWGNSELSQSIDIDGTCLPITKSLHLALCKLRDPEKPSAIWADAICIDQNNLQERSRQVRLMKQIYSGCECCVVHLGEEADGSELIPDFLYKGAYQQFLALTWMGENSIGTVIAPEANKAYGLSEMKDPIWPAFRCLLRRPWFRRVWVIQEFVFPDNVILQCGDWWIDGGWLAVLATMNNIITV